MEADCPPVFRVNPRSPVTAVVPRASITSALVGLLTVTTPTLIFRPALAVVAPCRKLVFWPVTWTVTVSPWRAELGVSRVRAAEPEVTVKLTASCTVSAPVVTEKPRKPMKAVGLTVMFAIALPALATVTELTVISGPKLAVVVPCVQ